MIRIASLLRHLTVFAAAGFALGLATSPAHALFENRYTAGHGDINIAYDSAGSRLILNYELGSNVILNGSPLGVAGAGEYDANTIAVIVGDNGLGTGAAGLPAPFAGNPLWILPQTSISGRPFVGIGAETIDPGLFNADTLTLSLTAMSVDPNGGQFVLYQFGSEATPFFNTANGITGADTLNVGAGSHDHFTFGFTAPGIYDVTLTATGTLTNNTIVTGSSVYRFEVSVVPVPEPGSIALMGIGMLSFGLVARRRMLGNRNA